MMKFNVIPRNKHNSNLPNHKFEKPLFNILISIDITIIDNIVCLIKCLYSI